MARNLNFVAPAYLLRADLFVFAGVMALPHLREHFSFILSYLRATLGLNKLPYQHLNDSCPCGELAAPVGIIICVIKSITYSLGKLRF